jgi:hypothetical protein
MQFATYIDPEGKQYVVQWDLRYEGSRPDLTANAPSRTHTIGKYCWCGEEHIYGENHGNH